MNSSHPVPHTHTDVSLEHSARLEHSALTRRSFLLASGVLAATAFSLNAQETLEQKPETLDAAQRENLLLRIEAVIKSNESASDREAQMETLTPLIATYRASIVNAPDLMLPEIVRAVEINRLKINMPHYNEGIEAAKAETFLSHNSISFYDDLFQRLQELKQRFPDEQRAIVGQLDIIRSDLIWSQAHGLNGVDRAVGTVIADRFINPAEKNLRGFDSVMSYSEERPLFHLTVLTRRFDAIATALDGEIAAVIDNSAKDRRNSVERIFDLATRVKSWVPFGIQMEIVPKSEQIVWQERIAERIEKPIFSHLVPLYLAAEADPTRSRPKQATTFWGVPIMLVAPPARPLMQRITSFLEDINGCRVELGNQFADSYAIARQVSNQYPEKVLGLVPVLAHLSPEPAKKKGIVDDLRSIFKSDMGRETAPQTIATMLEILLFSDHTFAASAKNQTLSAASSVQACLTVLDENGTMESLGNSATDAQKFAIELAQLCANSNCQERVTFTQNESKEYTEALGRAAEEVIGILVADIYTLSRHVSSSNDERTVTTVHLPQHWGGRDLMHTESTRAKELLASMQTLTIFADGIVKRLATFDLGTQNEALILDRLVFVTQLLDYRDDVKDTAFGHHANPYDEIKDRFPYLSTNAERGPFVDALKKARNVLYQKNHGTLPGNQQGSGINRKISIDNQLDTLALSYAKAAEKKFICSFILRLWNPDGSKDHRPLVGHRILSESRMAVCISRILHSYGMLDKYQDIRDALTEDHEHSVETVQKIRLQALAEQREALAQIANSRKSP